MKKILAFFSAVALLGTTGLSVIACGVPKGAKIDIVVETAPEKAKDTQDPLTEYVYNDKYNYNSANVNYLIGTAANLVSDKIRDSKQPGAEWEAFYASETWRYGSFSSFHYEPETSENAFSFRDKNGNEFVYQVKNNDASDDNNKVMTYWFITSAEPGQTPSKDNIVIPEASEFDHDSEIKTQTAWVHLFLLIGAFRIDFNVEINFNFTRITDVNKQQVVLFDLTSFTKPFGDISFENPPYDRVANITLSQS